MTLVKIFCFYILVYYYPSLTVRIEKNETHSIIEMCYRGQLMGAALYEQAVT